MGIVADRALFSLKKEFTESELKIAYRKRVKECHPDLASLSKQEEFIKVQEAYERLRKIKAENHEEKPLNSKVKSASTSTSTPKNKKRSSETPIRDANNAYLRYVRRVALATPELEILAAKISKYASIVDMDLYSSELNHLIQEGTEVFTLYKNVFAQLSPSDIRYAQIKTKVSLLEKQLSIYKNAMEAIKQ